MLTSSPFLPLAALISGGLFTFALGPFFWWPLGLVSLAGLFWILTQARSTWHAFRLSWYFSFAQFGTGVSWVYVSIHDHGNTPSWLAIPMVAVFAGFLALIPAFWFALRQRLLQQSLSWLTFAAFWLLQEWSRSWFLTGFPWLFAGDAHLFTWLSGWAPITGSYGISLILALTAASAIQIVRTPQAVYLLPFLLWPMGYGLQQIEWTQPAGKLTVAAVQGNVEQDDKWLPEQLFPTINRYEQDTVPLLGTDLILWPETAITMTLQRYQPYLEVFGDQARQQGSTVITGIPFRWPPGTEKAGRYHNSIVAFGAGDGLYHKQRLVPFGEYVPLAELIQGWIPFFDLPVYGFSKGQPDQAPLKVPVIRDGEETALVLAAPFICYEIAYPDLVLQGAKNADILLTISNDAWFGNSIGPKQHMALAQMRALETGRWVLRSTNTGISALVNHHGEIVDRIPVRQRTSFTATAERRSGSTPYMILGIRPLLLLILIILLAAAWVHIGERLRG